MKYVPMFFGDGKVILHPVDKQAMLKALEDGFTDDEQLYMIMEMHGLLVRYPVRLNKKESK